MSADDISVTAVVVRQWKTPIVGARCEVTLVLLANHIAVLNERKCAVNLLPEEIVAFEVRYTSGLARQLLHAVATLH